MAEVIGVAASGITIAQVAAQVGKSILKLKRLWDDFKDVPSSIGDLLDQIDCLDPALWEAENTFTQASLPPMFWNSSLGSRSTTYCRKALRSLTELVDELTLQLNRPRTLRSKVATAKVVLKKEQLRNLERRLHNAITMLSLAQSSYLVALTRLQPDIIIQRITECKTPLVTQTLQDDIQPIRQIASQTKEVVDNKQLEDRALPPRRYTKRQENAVYSIRFRLPMWACQAIWELQSFRSYGNWKFNLRYYYALPSGSDVFNVAWCGAPKDLQMLFASGQASPYDRVAGWGKTLLHYAVSGLNRPMVKYLLDIGLSPLEVDNRGRAPIIEMCDALVIRGNSDIFSFANWSFTDELNKLSDALDADMDSESKECNCQVGLISKEFFRTLQCLECPQHESTTPQSRLRSLMRTNMYLIHPMIIPDLLRRYWTQDLRALCIESVAISPLIHIVAHGLGKSHDNLSAEWASLAETVISNTPNIHCVEDCECKFWPRPWRWNRPCRLTPLLAVICSSSYDYLSRHNMIMKKLISRVTLWLSKVQSSGHDLEEYGRRETEMLMDKELQLDNKCMLVPYNDHIRRPKFIIGRIRGYQYGPEPKDWKILWSFPEKSYAADFWRLVEDGPQLVPGAWVEDSDDEEDDDWS
ncbi:hypothetical protein F4782DRAFT_506646 [Xylaria castorea]|nr:hypothetical protein F4782DRAFT_506646 [Xylaria castorea]